MEGWLKVFIGGADGEEFLASIHGRKDCISCHGGAPGVVSKEEAHAGLIVDPSEDMENGCNAACHSETKHYENSVHWTQAGYFAAFRDRAGFDLRDHPELAAGFAQDCSSCHASCGDCHISQPKNVGGGLISAHRVNRTPDMKRNCTACHGSRVGDEYQGLNLYGSPDVHYRSEAMLCVDCHSAEEMHGDNTNPSTRYAVEAMPQCEDCHSEVSQANSYHLVHFDELACQACHSQDYKNCNACHVGDGITGESYAAFKIGRNPIPELRDPEYVVLRHVPIASDTYANWGQPELDEFAALPSWKYASPHNIRRWTARTQVEEGMECYESCHGSPNRSDGWFLRAVDLESMTESEREANSHLVVPDGPPHEW